MRMACAALVAFSIGLVSETARAAPEIKMYGATWCGPCRAVKEYLGNARVQFTYLDIDDPKNREAFYKENGGNGGIPLVFVGGESIRGANLPKLQTALERAGVAKSAPAPAGTEQFCGHAPAWWQQQFRDLRGQIASGQARVAELSKAAADHYEKEVLAKMKQDQKILEQSLDVLESDASNCSLPRRYRE